MSAKIYVILEKEATSDQINTAIPATPVYKDQDKQEGRILKFILNVDGETPKCFLGLPQYNNEDVNSEINTFRNEAVIEKEATLKAQELEDRVKNRNVRWKIIRAAHTKKLKEMKEEEELRLEEINRILEERKQAGVA